ncbi:hypothetical protein ACVIYL_009035 [Bradyrhizobium sp. USDA 3315]
MRKIAMTINYEQLMAMKKLGQKYSYSDRDVMLYAIGIGMGADPLDKKELAFVNEARATPQPLKVVPTFASVAAGFAEPGEFNLNSIALAASGISRFTVHFRLLRISRPILASLLSTTKARTRGQLSASRPCGRPARANHWRLS